MNKITDKIKHILYPSQHRRQIMEEVPIEEFYEFIVKNNWVMVDSVGSHKGRKITLNNFAESLSSKYDIRISTWDLHKIFEKISQQTTSQDIFIYRMRSLTRKFDESQTWNLVENFLQNERSKEDFTKLRQILNETHNMDISDEGLQIILEYVEFRKKILAHNPTSLRDYIDSFLEEYWNEKLLGPTQIPYDYTRKYAKVSENHLKFLIFLLKKNDLFIPELRNIIIPELRNIMRERREELKKDIHNLELEMFKKELLE